MILTVKYTTNGSGEHGLNAAIIAATLLTMISYSKKVSGACLNPAVGLDQSIYQHFKTKDDKNQLKLASMWIYIFAPSLGGILAGLLSIFNRTTSEEYFNNAINDTESNYIELQKQR